MKTLKTFITLVLMLVGMTATAQIKQTIITVEWNDGTIDEYPLSEVDSVAYVPTGEGNHSQASLAGATLIGDYSMSSVSDKRSLIANAGTVTPSGATVEWVATTDSTAPTLGWTTTASDVKPTSAGTWNVYYRITSKNSNYSNKTATKLGTVTVNAFVGEVDRNVYSDLAATIVMFDSSKVSTTSVEGKPWASQIIVTPTTQSLVMNIPFKVYTESAAGTCELAWTAKQHSSGIYFVNDSTIINGSVVIEAI